MQYATQVKRCLKRWAAISLAKFSRQLTRTSPYSYLSTLNRLGLEVELAVDAGAHLGSWTKVCRQIYPSTKVIMIEPQAKLLDSCKRRFAGHQDLTFVECGLYDADGEMPLFPHVRADSFSLIPTTKSMMDADLESVRVRRLDRLCIDLVGEATPSIVKLDCEGVELEALEGSGSLVGVVPVFVVEAGLNNPSFRNSLSVMQAWFERRGYKLVDIVDAVRADSGVLWNVDLVFVLRGHPLSDACERFHHA